LDFNSETTCIYQAIISLLLNLFMMIIGMIIIS